MTASRLLHFFRRACAAAHIPPGLLEVSAMRVFALPRIAPPDNAAEFRVEQIDENRLADVCACRQMRDPDAAYPLLRRRLVEGSACYVMYHGAAPVGFAWISRGTNVLEDSDRYRMNLGSDGGYIYDTFLAPDYRGRGLYRALLARVQGACARGGITRFFLTVDLTNERSLRAHGRLDVEYVETVVYVCVCGFSFHCARGASGSCRQVDPPWRRREFASRNVSSA